MFGIYSTYHGRISTGSDVVEDWQGRYANGHIRYPNQQETARFKAQYQLKIDDYIAQHSELDEKRKVDLRSLRPKIGMTKQEVALFLIGPFEKIDSQEGLAINAGKYWPELKNRVSEVWISKYGYEGLKEDFFFQGDTLIDIHADIPTTQPL